MKFGIFYELSVPRPFSRANEWLTYHNALEQCRVADKAAGGHAHRRSRHERGRPMISGTASVDKLARNAAEIEAFGSESVTLSGVTSLALAADLRRPAREEVLPPALHPIVPPAMSLLAWDVSDSPWGPFSAAFVRIVCRSGARARTFCVGAAASTAESVAELRSQLGFSAQPAARADRNPPLDLTRRAARRTDRCVRCRRVGPAAARSVLDNEPLGVARGH